MVEVGASDVCGGCWEYEEVRWGGGEVEEGRGGEGWEETLDVRRGCYDFTIDINGFPALGPHAGHDCSTHLWFSLR